MALWFLWIFAGYVLFCLAVWALLLDEYDGVVLGWQQTNFTAHERARLLVLLPGLPLIFVLILLLNIREWRTFGELTVNFAESVKHHWAIVVTGSRAGYEKPKTDI